MPIYEFSPEMMREIILDHYSHPQRKGVPEAKENYQIIHADSTNCIDDFDLFLLIKEEVVEDAMWEGVACAISTSSTDILCEKLIGMKKEDALYLIEQYLAMIAEKPYNKEVLEEALAFMNTGKQAARIHCATMAWVAAKELLEGKKNNE